MQLPRSPLAPKKIVNLALPRGVKLGVARTGMKYQGRDDFMLLTFPKGATIAGRFTTSATAGPPVAWCKEVVGGGVASAIAVNAGIANAFTGQAGRKVVADTASSVAAHLGCEAQHVIVSSTGVIGEPPNIELLRPAVAKAAEQAAGDGAPWLCGAQAIATTDTFPKVVGETLSFGDRKVSICGMVKGSGMIAPNMATMLGYVVTDAAVPSRALDKILGEAVEQTFNCITVDSDTSTSDTLIIAATGEQQGDELLEGPELADFAAAVLRVCKSLALQVVRDGEGATKMIEVLVEGADTRANAKKVAMAIANSPLVKTAVAGEDANWGRIVMAAGKAGVPFDQDRLSLWIGDTKVASSGQIAKSFREEDTAQHLEGDHVVLKLDLGVADGADVTCWTCDLGHGYIDINVDYRS